MTKQLTWSLTRILTTSHVSIIRKQDVWRNNTLLMSSPPTINMTDWLIAASGGVLEVGLYTLGVYDDFGVTLNAIWPSVMAVVGDEMVPEVSEELMADVAAWMVVEVKVFGVTVVDETYPNQTKQTKKKNK